MAAKIKLKKLYEIFMSEYDLDNDILSLLPESRCIPLEKEYQFIDNVVDNCFGNMLEYQPEYFTLAMFVNVLYFYYGVKHNNEKCMVDMLYGRDFYDKSIRDIIIGNVSVNQLDSIRKAAASKIEYRKEQFLRLQGSTSDEVLAKIGDAVDNINSILANFNQYSELDNDGLAGILQGISEAMNSGDAADNAIVEGILNYRDKQTEMPIPEIDPAIELGGVK